MNDERILEFIKASRSSIGDESLSENIINQLEELFYECLNMVSGYFSENSIPSLIVCNTYEKYSAIMPVRDKKSEPRYYVLFDYHMIKISGLLNAIYLDETAAEHDIWKFSYGLFSEESIIRKDEILMTFYGLNNTALGPFLFDYIDQQQLSFITDIQERYIIGHEIGHLIYRRVDKESKQLQFNSEFYEEWMRNKDSVYKLLENLYQDYLSKYKGTESEPIIQEHIDTLKNSKEIQEELFADAIAYSVVFSYIEKQYVDDIEKKLLAEKALLLQMMNLQILSMARKTLIEEDSFEIAVSIRIGFLRNYSVSYFEEYEKEFDQLLNDTIDRYENRITNNILECFAELEDRAENIYDALTDINGELDLSRIYKMV